MKFKKLIEKRNELIEEMRSLITGAETEERALSEEENTRFDEIKNEIRGIDQTLQQAEESQQFENRKMEEGGSEEQQEERAFVEFIRGSVLEQRADVNLTKGDNGAVIPKTVARKIIEQVKELSPIYSMATVYNVKGTLAFPVWGDNDGDNVTCAYANEFESLTSHSGKFTTVEMTGFLAGALTKVSKSLINNSDFDILSFVVKKVAQAISEFLEKELIVGTEGKMSGVLSAEVGVKAAAGTLITADEIIDLEMSIPETYATNACFIMHKDTFKAIRKLKDGNDNYILNRDVTRDFGWDLLGHKVYITESMPKMAAGNKAIAYGDMSGLCVKMPAGVEMQVLTEKFATEHAIGVIGWVEADSKIIEPQKIRVLQMGN